MLFSKHELITTSAILIAMLSTLLLPAPVLAHNKVVVIPMAGDDIEIEIIPKPVTKESPPNSDYIVNGLISVVDKITGLEWQRLDDNALRTLVDARQYCLDLSLDGITDWRLPLVAELVSLLDYDSFDPTINSTAFPATNSSSYWSASSYELFDGLFWAVFFNMGNVDYNISAFGSAVAYVRCVR